LLQQALSSSKKRRVQTPLGESVEDGDSEPPEWTMELTAVRARESISPTTIDSSDKKDKLSPDDSCKSGAKSENLK